jgi:anti-sigma regulatory factor (Ser/Thr protein kinase)
VSSRGPSATVRLAFPPEPRLLGTIRLVVGIVARNAGVDEEGIEDLKVAVSETCAVAVGDLSQAGLDTVIELDLTSDGDRFGVEVRDRAPGGASAMVIGDPVNIDDRQFGLALVGALVDDLRTVAREGGGHQISFSLPRAVAGEPPGPA